jgi:hypothetical protein
LGIIKKSALSIGEHRPSFFSFFFTYTFPLNFFSSWNILNPFRTTESDLLYDSSWLILYIKL